MNNTKVLSPLLAAIRYTSACIDLCMPRCTFSCTFLGAFLLLDSCVQYVFLGLVLENFNGVKFEVSYRECRKGRVTGGGSGNAYLLFCTVFFSHGTASSLPLGIVSGPLRGSERRLCKPIYAGGEFKKPNR